MHPTAALIRARHAAALLGAVAAAALVLPSAAAAGTSCPGSTTPSCPWTSHGGFAGAGISSPVDVAADDQGHVVYAMPSTNQWGLSVAESDFDTYDLPPRSNPAGIAFDARRRVLVSSAASNRILVYTQTGTRVDAYGPQLGGGGGSLDEPHGIAVDDAGRIWVADTGNDRIVVLDATGAYLSQISGVQQLNRPTNVAVDAAGFVWVSNAGNGTLLRFDNRSPAFQVIRARIGIAEPAGIGIDNQSNRVFVADVQANRILIFNRAGTFQAAFGTRGAGVGQFQAPMGLAVDGIGTLWVADRDNQSIDSFGFGGARTAVASLAAPAAIVTGRGTARVPLRCATRLAARCTGLLTLRRGARVARVRFSIPAGRATNVAVRLARAHHAAVRQARRLRHAATVTTERPSGLGSVTRRAIVELRHS